jgi:peptidoglycan/xylan/chitin deacetylase (PgdA/CDA1 family)
VSWRALLGRRRGRSALVLLYHRIARHPRDPFRLNVAPERFAGQLDVLARRARVVPLADVVAGRAPTGAVALTFDDGYADALDIAAPELARRGLPATLFAISDLFDAAREPWWDALERCLLDPPALPETLELDGLARFRLPPHDFAPASAAWREASVYSPADASPRHRVLRELSALLGRLSCDERDAAVERLHDWSGTPRAPRASHRPLAAAELRQLADAGTVAIGAHSRRHPRLAMLDAPAQRDEIAGSRRALEGALGRPVDLFAYPHGGRHDYDATSIAAVRAAGFAAACSNFPGLVTVATSRFELPRQLVHDDDAAIFEAKLAGWLEGRAA